MTQEVKFQIYIYCTRDAFNKGRVGKFSELSDSKNSLTLNVSFVNMIVICRSQAARA
jgi:hypothetical protein